MRSRIPPVSPASTMLTKSWSKTFGWRAIAAASVEPSSTSCRICVRTMLEVLVLLLLREDLQTLDERQTGVDHDGELAREDGEVFGLDLLAPAADLRHGDLAPLLLDRGEHDLLAAQQLSAARRGCRPSRSPTITSPSRFRPLKTYVGMNELLVNREP